MNHDDLPQLLRWVRQDLIWLRGFAAALRQDYDTEQFDGVIGNIEENIAKVETVLEHDA